MTCNCNKTLNDPEVKKSIEAQRDELRKDTDKLLQWYVEGGFLTKFGKLTERYGGLPETNN